MEAVAVRVADQNVAGVRDVDAVREARDLLVADAMQERAVLVENGHIVALEVAHVEVRACEFARFVVDIIIVACSKTK